MQQADTKAKSSSFVRMPKLSPLTRLILLAGIFLVIAIPLLVILSQQGTRQAELNHQYSILQKALGNRESAEALKRGMEEEINQARRGLDAIKAAFPNPDRSPEIVDSLIELAKLNGIAITKTQVTNLRSSIKVSAEGLEYPVLSFDINLKGQVPKFQNFLLALNSKFLTSELKRLNFKIPEVPEEEATANVVLNVYSSEVKEAAGGEIPVIGKNPIVMFSDKKDKTTDIFKIKGSKWRIDWKATVLGAKWSGITLIIYRKGETGRYIDIVPWVGGNLEGTSYIYEGGGEFYVKVVTANVSNWEIKIYE